MTASIMGSKRGKGKKWAAALGAAAFWLLIWQLLAMLVGREVVLSPPLTVLKTLGEMVKEGSFWLALLASLLRILAGFALGVVLGLGLGLLTAFCPPARMLLSPFMSVVKATPVASFIILLLFLTGNQWIPVIIAALMVLPIIWANAVKGIEETDPALLEMGRVFELSPGWQMRQIYGPSLKAFFRPAALTALGLSWKAGIAAEVLAAPEHSLGGMLYRAKVYLENPRMLALTLCVIVVSMGLEALLKRGLSSAGQGDKK